MDREDLLALQEEKAHFLHVFFVIVYENDKEDRLLVPMKKELMTYLPLRFPGEHLILAQIVWTEGGVNDWWYNERWLLDKMSRDRYKNYVLNHSRDEIDNTVLRFRLTDYRPDGSLNLTAALRVNVPKEFFPKEPSAWMKRWVNLFHEYDAADQCQFRRRALGAFTFQPFLVALYLILRPMFGAVIALFFLGLGFRKVNVGVLRHPWLTSLDELYKSRRSGKSWSFWKRNNSWFMEYADGRKKSKVWWLLNPFVLGFVWLVLSAVSRRTGMTYLEIIEYSVVTIAIWLGTIAKATPYEVLLLLAGIALVTFLVIRLSKSIRDHRILMKNREMLPEVQEQRRLEQENAKHMALEEQIRILTCERVPKRRPSIEDIPQQYRTIRLRYLDLKARVCRPFAGH